MGITKVKAFSLIELLVVITIIAIIAAVAVPSYQKYITRSKINSAVQIMNSYNEKYKILYPTTNNSTGTQVNNTALATLPDNPSPYIALLTSYLTPPTNADCGYVSTSAYVTNLNATGGNVYVTGEGYYTYLALYDIEQNGQFVRYCLGDTLLYDTFSSSAPITGLLPEGCYDIHDPAQLAAYNAAVTNLNASSPCITPLSPE